MKSYLQAQVDASRLAIAGDSAGGNTTAVVSLLAKERKGPAITAQLCVERGKENRAKVGLAILRRGLTKTGRSGAEGLLFARLPYALKQQPNEGKGAKVAILQPGNQCGGREGAQRWGVIVECNLQTY